MAESAESGLLWRILGFFGGLLTKRRLVEMGASKDEVKGAVTVTATLPTFAAPEPQPPAGVKESRDLAYCHPELRKRYLALKADFEQETGRQLFETCTWRSKERQNELFQIGRRGVPGEKIRTKIDGITKKSRHNVFPSEAVDVAVDKDPGPGRHPVWDGEAYVPLGPLALKHGLRWGGDWNRNGSSKDEEFIDDPHLELPPEAA